MLTLTLGNQQVENTLVEAVFNLNWGKSAECKCSSVYMYMYIVYVCSVYVYSIYVYVCMFICMSIENINVYFYICFCLHKQNDLIVDEYIYIYVTYMHAWHDITLHNK